MYYTSTGTNTSTITAGYGFNAYVQPSVVVEMPVRCGDGPPLFSTETALDVVPYFTWDHNYLYRALGFEWPFRGITKKMLMRAYQDLDGQADAFMTHAFKMLLDPEFRSRYDRLPFGARAIDKYVFEEMKRAAHQMVSDAAARGHQVQMADAMEHLGVPVEPIQPVSDEEGPSAERDEHEPEVSESDDTVSRTWMWGYFLWRSRCENRARLERWQELLLAAAREVGLRTNFAIGFFGRAPQRTSVGQFEDCFVVFLNEVVEPDEELAAQAVSTIMKMIAT